MASGTSARPVILALERHGQHVLQGNRDQAFDLLARQAGRFGLNLDNGRRELGKYIQRRLFQRAIDDHQQQLAGLHLLPGLEGLLCGSLQNALTGAETIIAWPGGRTTLPP